MQIQYRLTFKDYLAAQALHARRNVRAFFVFALSRYIYPGLGICFLIFLLLATKPMHTLFTSPGNYWGLFACAVLLCCPFFVRWSLNRCYKRTRTGSGDCSIDFDPELIRTRMEYAKSEIEWPAISRFAEDKNVFLLYMAQAKFLVIPKRILSPEQIEEARALFMAKTPSVP